MRTTCIEVLDGCNECKLVIDYQIGNRVIRYDMRLGAEMEAPPAADELSANPDLPTHDVDVRVLDDAGRPFVIQMAGHGFLDASWNTPAIEGFDETGAKPCGSSCEAPARSPRILHPAPAGTCHAHSLRGRG